LNNNSIVVSLKLSHCKRWALPTYWHLRKRPTNSWNLMIKKSGVNFIEQKGTTSVSFLPWYNI